METSESAVIRVQTYLGGKLKTTNPNAKVTIVIDGQIHKLPFGEPSIAIVPGRHVVSVYWGAQFRKGRPAITVETSAGYRTTLRCDIPNKVWQPGTLTVVGSDRLTST
jgi:hypothetical protein